MTRAYRYQWVRRTDGEYVALPKLDADPGELTWQDDALCAEVGTEPFFVEKGESPRPAKRVCARCPVRAECLDYALQTDQRFGIWGGTSPAERAAMTRTSRAAGPEAA